MPSSRQGKRKCFRVEIAEVDETWSAIPDCETVIAVAAKAVVGALAGEVPSGTIAFALSSDMQVAELNERFRGKATPTNVLSFPSRTNDRGHIGDIIIAYETVAREADEQGVSVKDHVQHLAVHGILHLLGYDHDDDAAAERMEALEIRILSKLGVANPYTNALETLTKA